MLKQSNKKAYIFVLLLVTSTFCLFNYNRVMALQNNEPMKKIIQQNKKVSSNLVKKQASKGQNNLVVKGKTKTAKNISKVVESKKASIAVTAEKVNKNTNSISTFCMPVNGVITSKFGYRKITMPNGSIIQGLHEGMDVAANAGTKICAAFGGTVKFAGVQGGYGNTIILSHANGIETLYGHCSKLTVRSGETIRKGQEIGAVGSTGRSTGPHVHFEVRVNGKPVNPASYIGSNTIQN